APVLELLRLVRPHGNLRDADLRPLARRRRASRVGVPFEPGHGLEAPGERAVVELDPDLDGLVECHEGVADARRVDPDADHALEEAGAPLRQDAAAVVDVEGRGSGDDVAVPRREAGVLVDSDLDAEIGGHPSASAWGESAPS